MMDQLEALFRRDFWLKVLAVALAILLWTMVVEDYNKETTRSFDVSLMVKHHPVFEIFEGKQDMDTRVEIRVTGPSLLINSLSEEDFTARVDYSRITEAGRQQDVEVEVEGPARIREQVKYRVLPATVPVTLVRKRTMPVTIEVQPNRGVVLEGGREFSYTAAPVEKTKNLEGREDALTQVRLGLVQLESGDLRPPVAATGLREKTTQVSKPIQPVDGAGKLVEKLGQSYTDILITWEELPPGRTVQVQPQTSGFLPSGFELVRVVTDPATITLRSTTLNGTVPDLSVIQTEPVILTGQTNNFTVAVRLIAPQGTNPVVGTVNVTVMIAETTLEKVFGALPVAVHGQPANTDLAVQVSTVQVRLKGPFTLLQPMDAGAVQVFVDLDGLEEGRHSVPVKHTYPPGVTEVAVDPAVIEVVITKR